MSERQQRPGKFVCGASRQVVGYVCAVVERRARVVYFSFDGFAFAARGCSRPARLPRRQTLAYAARRADQQLHRAHLRHVGDGFQVTAVHDARGAFSSLMRKSVAYSARATRAFWECVPRNEQVISALSKIIGTVPMLFRWTLQRRSSPHDTTTMYSIGKHARRERLRLRET